MRVLMALAAIFAIASCGSTSTSGSGSGTQGTPGNSEASKYPNEILNDAAATLGALNSYHVVFSGKDTIGSLTFDLEVDGSGQSAKGTMVQSGISSPVVITGSNLYVEQQPLAEALLQRVFATTVGGWVRVPLTTIPNLATLVSPSALQSCVTDDGVNVTAGSQSKIAGVPALALALSDDANNSNALEVSLDGRTNIVQWTIQQAGPAYADCTGGVQVGAGTDPKHPTSLIGTLTFNNFNQNVSVSTPSPAVDPPPLETSY